MTTRRGFLKRLGMGVAGAALFCHLELGRLVPVLEPLSGPKNGVDFGAVRELILGFKKRFGFLPNELRVTPSEWRELSMVCDLGPEKTWDVRSRTELIPGEPVGQGIVHLTADVREKTPEEKLWQFGGIDPIAQQLAVANDCWIAPAHEVADFKGMYLGQDPPDQDFDRMALENRTTVKAMEFAGRRRPDAIVSIIQLDLWAADQTEFTGTLNFRERFGLPEGFWNEPIPKMPAPGTLAAAVNENAPAPLVPA